MTPTRPTLELLEGRDVPSTAAMNFADGLWRWDSTDGWGHLTTAGWQAENCCVDSAGDVFADFGTKGLWRFSDSDIVPWKQLSTQNVGAMDCTAGGALYGDFGASGLWYWDAAGNAQCPTAADPGAFTVSDANSCFVNFSNGIWRWSPTDGWAKLTSVQGSQLGSDDSGHLVARISNGTFRWSPSSGDPDGTWSLLRAGPVDSVVVSDNGVVWEDRGADGLWRWTAGTGFQQQKLYDVSQLRALPNGSVLMDYGGSTYYYNATTVTFVVASSSYTSRAVGANSDVFFDLGGSGVGHWTLAGGMTTLTPANPSGLWSQDRA